MERRAFSTNSWCFLNTTRPTRTNCAHFRWFIGRRGYRDGGLYHKPTRPRAHAVPLASARRRFGWAGACYWHDVGGFMFNSPSSASARRNPRRGLRELETRNSTPHCIATACHVCCSRWLQCEKRNLRFFMNTRKANGDFWHKLLAFFVFAAL